MGALAELDAAVAGARADVLVAAGPLALAVVGWVMVRRKRRAMAEHLAALDAIVAESRDVPEPPAPATGGLDDGSAGPPEPVDVDALAAELHREAQRDREAERRRV